jgi:TetR/AcrR family tetracycline transcriptional repressor
MYVTGFVLQEQATPRPDTTTQDPLAALAGMLGGDTSATLITAFRDRASSVGEDTSEHGLRVLINGTAAALDDEG